MDCCHKDPISPKITKGSLHAQNSQTEAPGEVRDDFTSRNDYTWFQIGICAVVAGQSMVWSLAVNLSEIALYSIPYFAIHGVLLLSAIAVLVIAGRPLFSAAWKQILKVRLGIESLFLISLLGALGGSVYASFTGTGKIYYEVIAIVLLIYTFGSRLGRISRNKALAEIHKLREQFDFADVLQSNGDTRRLSIRDIQAGDQVVVKAGQPISLDGIILEGRGFIKETPITGEPNPVSKSKGEAVQAGTWSVDADFTIQVTSADERLLDKITQEIEQTITSTKSEHQLIAERWIHYFVILVTTIAAISGLFWSINVDLTQGWLTSMAVLLIACPCALGLATPLAIWSGIWKLSNLGIVSRDSRIIDSLANTRHVFFDKTGTLTKPDVAELRFEYIANPYLSDESAITLSKTLEKDIPHPISQAFDKLDGNTELPENLGILSKRWVAGFGVEAQIQIGARIHFIKLGSYDWAVEASRKGGAKSSLALSIDDELCGQFEITEQLRPGIAKLFNELREKGIRCSILTGDSKPAWQTLEGVAVQSGLNPLEKAQQVEESADLGYYPLYVGDGINDLNAMNRSASSIALADSAASVTTSNATAVLIGNHLSTLVRAIQFAKSIQKTLRSNILIAVSYNLIGITLAVTGNLHPIAAALIMVLSSLLVTFRAIVTTEKLNSEVKDAPLDLQPA